MACRGCWLSRKSVGYCLAASARSVCRVRSAPLLQVVQFCVRKSGRCLQVCHGKLVERLAQALDVPGESALCRPVVAMAEVGAARSSPSSCSARMLRGSFLSQARSRHPGHAIAASSQTSFDLPFAATAAAHHVVIVEQWLTGDEEGEGDHGGRDKPAAHGFSHQGGTAGDSEFGGRCQNALTHRARLHAQVAGQLFEVRPAAMPRTH